MMKKGTCYDNVDLTIVSFPRLTYTEEYIQVVNTGSSHFNAALTWIDLRSLSTLKGYFLIQQCSVLTSLSLPALTYVGQYFYIYENLALATLTAPVLTKVANLNLNVWAIEICANSGSLAFASIAQASVGQSCFLGGNVCSLQTCPCDIANHFYLPGGGTTCTECLIDGYQIHVQLIFLTSFLQATPVSFQTAPILTLEMVTCAAVRHARTTTSPQTAARPARHVSDISNAILWSSC